MNSKIMDDFYGVIMAGGGGTRLWPLSRKAHPKQFLKLGSDLTLFQMATDRLKGLIPPERILVVTVADMAEGLSQMVPEIPQENFLLEAAPRGTASVVGMAAAHLRSINPQAVMAILTADHVIENVSLFRDLLSTAYQAARQNYLVTLGIEPTAPSTAYGYIQSGESLTEIDGLVVYAVKKFKEKPDESTAKAMLAGGDHTWNSGMFIWSVENIWAEFARQMPELFRTLQQYQGGLGDPQQAEYLKDLWLSIKAQTIDYGIMENAQRVAVIPAMGLGWNDVGSWDSLYEVFAPDSNGNILLSDSTISLETANTAIVSEKQDRLIATIGVKDLVIIDTGDVLLICHQSKAQKVREMVDLLKQTGKSKFL